MASGRPPFQSPFQHNPPASDPFGGVGHFGQQNATTAPGPQVPPPPGPFTPAGGVGPFQHSAPPGVAPPVHPFGGAEPTQFTQPPPAPVPPPPAAGAGARAEAEKSTLTSHVFHENLTTSAGVATPLLGTNGLHQRKTDAELLEKIKSLNAPTNYIRTTLGVLPSSLTLQQKTHVPLGLTIRPMAPLKEGDEEIPVINHGAESICRCTKCRTYINPFVTFESNRRNWICNLCGVSNETPARYLHLPNDPNSEHLPVELKSGVVEYIASADYMVRPPQAPTLMFVIDVSAAAVACGMVEEVCAAISDLIKRDALPGGPRTLVGVVTFDTSVHFYQMHKGVENMQILIVSDLEDLFLPLPGEIFLNVHESANDLLHLLDSIPKTWMNNTVSGSCMGSATRAAHFAMKHIGGKMCIFTASPSYFGDFSLNASATMQHKKGGPNLQPVEKCKEYANMICQTQVAVELFVCTPQSVNLPGIYHLAVQTAGAVHYIPYKSHYGTNKLRSELERVLTRPTGWEAVMRIRASKGWNITNWFGHCFVRGSDLMVLPNCHCDQTYTITFEHEERVVAKRIAYFQSALLHTTSSGQRRIRVATKAIPVSDNFTEILLSLDTEACVLTAAHLAIKTGLRGKLADARSLLQNLCTQIAGAMSTLQPPPESAGRIVMYLFGLLKSNSFSEGSATPVDARMYHWLRLQVLPLENLAAYCYPRLIPLHEVSEYGKVPTSLNLTHTKLVQQGAYLVENGDEMILWIGKDVSQQFLLNTFNVPTFDALDVQVAETQLKNSQGPVAQVIDTVRSQRLPYMPLQVVKQGQEAELKFYSFLIEDKTPGMMMSLQEFLTAIVARSPFSFKQPHN